MEFADLSVAGTGRWLVMSRFLFRATKSSLWPTVADLDISIELGSFKIQSVTGIPVWAVPIPWPLSGGHLICGSSIELQN